MVDLTITHRKSRLWHQIRGSQQKSLRAIRVREREAYKHEQAGRSSK